MNKKPFSIKTLAENVRSFCQKRPIQRLEVFGSIAKGDAGEDSDVDLLVTFHENAFLTSLDIVSMKMELEKLLGRAVDLVERPCIEQSSNPFRKRAILNVAKEIYAA